MTISIEYILTEKFIVSKLDKNFHAIYGKSNFDGINRNEIRDEIRRRINYGNAFYYSL
jgi:hypothetical protein